jgi:hypothetical protein
MLENLLFLIKYLKPNISKVADEPGTTKQVITNLSNFREVSCFS